MKTPNKKPVRYLYITAYKLNIGKNRTYISLRESKYYDVEKGEFLFCFTENINKIKNRQEWFQSDLEEEYLHEIYPLYSPGEEDDEYEDEDGEKCSIMRNNV